MYEFYAENKDKIFCPECGPVLSRWFLENIDIVELNLKKGVHE